MAAYDLELLVSAIESVFNNAKSALRQKQAGTLEHVIDIGADGAPITDTWVARMPALDGRDHTYELMRLPLSGLLSGQQMEISELLVEFDGRLKIAHNKPESQPGQIMIVPGQRLKPRTRDLHHIKISLNGPDAGEASVAVDGIGLEEIDDLATLDSSRESSHSDPHEMPDNPPRHPKESKGRFPGLKPIQFWFLIALLMAAGAVILFLA